MGNVRSVDVEKVDGRELRWREHNVDRRLGLLDATLAAVRTHGHDIGMNEIASANGVSMSLLYKHFSSKNDLIGATAIHYIETVLTPRIYAAVSAYQDEYQLMRAVITAYVDAVVTDREIYLYVFTNSANDRTRDVVSEAERVVAQLLSSVIEDRLRSYGKEPGGAVPIAFGIVGAVRLTVHWWITDRTMSSDSLVGYLTMMLWGGISGIADVRGSSAEFEARPHPLIVD